MNCSIFLKNVEKHFCDLTYEKKLRQTQKNLPQHLSEKFIGDNISITDIALKNLSIIGIAQSIFEIIDYRYRFSTERFIVPITALLRFYSKHDKRSYWSGFPRKIMLLYILSSKEHVCVRPNETCFKFKNCSDYVLINFSEA